MSMTPLGTVLSVGDVLLVCTAWIHPTKIRNWTHLLLGLLMLLLLA